MRWRKYQPPEDPFVAAAEDPTSFGNLAIERGWISPHDLEEALELQRRRVPKLGQVLIEIGAVSEEQRDELLFEQRRRRGQKIPVEELRQFERRKMRRRLAKIKQGFAEASGHAESFAESLGILAREITDGSK